MKKPKYFIPVVFITCIVKQVTARGPYLVVRDVDLTCLYNDFRELDCLVATDVECDHSQLLDEGCYNCHALLESFSNSTYCTLLENCSNEGNFMSVYPDHVINPTHRITFKVTDLMDTLYFPVQNGEKISETCFDVQKDTNIVCRQLNEYDIMYMEYIYDNISPNTGQKPSVTMAIGQDINTGYKLTGQHLGGYDLQLIKLAVYQTETHTINSTHSSTLDTYLMDTSYRFNGQDLYAIKYSKLEGWSFPNYLYVSVKIVNTGGRLYELEHIKRPTIPYVQSYQVHDQGNIAIYQQLETANDQMYYFEVINYNISQMNEDPFLDYFHFNCNFYTLEERFSETCYNECAANGNCVGYFTSASNQCILVFVNANIYFVGDETIDDHTCFELSSATNFVLKKSNNFNSCINLSYLQIYDQISSDRIIMTKKQKDFVGTRPIKFYIVHDMKMCAQLCDLYFCETLRIGKFGETYTCQLQHEMALVLNFNVYFDSYELYLPAVLTDEYDIQKVPMEMELNQNLSIESTYVNDLKAITQSLLRASTTTCLVEKAETILLR